MQMQVLYKVIEKSGMKSDEIGAVVAGDLQTMLWR